MMAFDRSGVSLPEVAFPLRDFIDRRNYGAEYTAWKRAAMAYNAYLSARPRWLAAAIWYHLPRFYWLRHRHEIAYRAYMAAYDAEWWQAKARQDAVLKEYAA